LGFQSEILPTYLVILCAYNGVIINQLAYCILVMRITVMPPNDFIVLKTLAGKRVAVAHTSTV